MQTVRFRMLDGKMSDVIKGVYMLEASDLYPHFDELSPGLDVAQAVPATSAVGAQATQNAESVSQNTGAPAELAQAGGTLAESAKSAVQAEADTKAEVKANAVDDAKSETEVKAEESKDSKDNSDAKAVGQAQGNARGQAQGNATKRSFTLSSEIKARSFASLQLRAKSAMRALFKHSNEHLLVLCVSSNVDGISCCEDLVREIVGVTPTIAYAPTKFELFGSEQEPGILTAAGDESAEAIPVIMPCSHLNDHPKWLGMLDACLAQNSKLKLILCGDAADIGGLSMMWPTLDNAIHADVVLEFSSVNALEIIAGLISHYQKSYPDLLAFTYEAVNLLATYCCRLSGDRRYIGLTELKLQSLIFEANQRARHTGKSAVDKQHVLWALCADDFRNNYLSESVLRDHRDRQLLISTKGAVVGQINGLSVVETLGTSYEYGEPVRITATARAGGEGDVIDIERKAELAGQIHAKAMMIINGFLTKEFGSEQPLPVSASLVFEQSYSEVDGDSASLTGLCAVISALAQVPIRQDLAVTGAVDQFGDVQAVGGVNEKIEGFFRVCKLHGLNGTQGVIIPSSCVNQLVLRPSVVKAVAEGKFHIFTVSHVTQAVKLLTTLDWGDAETEGTVCERITERLNNIIAGSHALPWYAEFYDWVCSLFSRDKGK